MSAAVGALTTRHDLHELAIAEHTRIVGAALLEQIGIGNVTRFAHQCAIVEPRLVEPRIQRTKRDARGQPRHIRHAEIRVVTAQRVIPWILRDSGSHRRQMDVANEL